MSQVSQTERILPTRQVLEAKRGSQILSSKKWLIGIFGCLLSLLLPPFTPAQDAPPSHEDAIQQLEALNAQITYRDSKDGSGNIILATDGAWKGGDEGLKLLHAVEGLYKLRLGGDITDAGLAHVSTLEGLTSLDVHVLSITDAGVAHLERLTELQRLNLTYTKVSDAGLKSLLGLKKLKWLGLAYTQVTAEGAKDLRKLLPNTIIEGNFRR